MPRKSQGMTGRKRVSKRRQIEAKAKAVSQQIPPAPNLPEPALPEMPPSPIAEWILDPSPAKWSRLQIAASLGRLTKADLQSAFMAQLSVEVSHHARDPEGFEEFARKAYVNRQRLLRSLLDVVKQSTSSGPTQLVRIVWPSREVIDRGEDVRLEAPDEPN